MIAVSDRDDFGDEELGVVRSSQVSLGIPVVHMAVCICLAVAIPGVTGTWHQ